MRWLLRNATVYDPLEGIDGETRDVLVVDGAVRDVRRPGGTPVEPGDDLREIDLTGKWLVPGLMDMHVHLREPGREDEETIASGARAAARGGFTDVCCMPNTEPALDTASSIRFVVEQGNRAGAARVHPIGAVSRGRTGGSLVEMGDLVDAGAVAFSDDGSPVATAGLLRRAIEYSAMFGVPVIDHCEDLSLTGRGVMHEGVASARIGIRAVPGSSEDVCVARDILVAESLGLPIHLAHVSTARSVSLIREAKARGVRVTAETCSHYLLLTDEDVAASGYDPLFRVNPPLRSAADRDAVIEGVVDGTLDALVTDHAPHAPEEKEAPFEEAPPGFVGIEIAVGLNLKALVEPGLLSPLQLVERMSAAPRRVLGLPQRRVRAGDPADLTVIDPASPYRVDPARFVSKSRNTPFAGRELPGRAVLTLTGGRITHAEPDLAPARNATPEPMRS